MRTYIKTIFLSLCLTLMTVSTHAGWTDADRFEPMIGCGGMAAAYQYQNNTKAITDNMQGILMYCAIGFAAGAALNMYYSKKEGEKGREKYEKLKTKTTQLLHELAKARSEGVDVGKPRFKEKRVPGGFIGNGEYQGDSIRYIPYIPSDKMILGD